MNIGFIEGKKEGSSIYHCNDGFFYHYNNGNNYLQNDEGFVSVANLRCKNYYSRQCRGTARVDINGNEMNWTNIQRHTCAPDHNHLPILILWQQILEESVNEEGPYETPSEVVNRVRERFRVHIAARVTANRMRSAISRARGHLYPQIPATLLNLGDLLTDNPHLCSTLQGRDSIFSGTVHGPRGTVSLVFVSRIGRYFQKAKLVACDGTFNSRPHTPNSAQVLQIVGAIDHHVLPLVTVLTTGKTQPEYEAILRYLQQRFPRFRPRIVLTDFETALQNAWREVFHCHVALAVTGISAGLAVIINARLLSLTALLRGNRIARSLVRSLLAIPLLPQHFMDRGLRVLINEARRRGLLNVLNGLFEYFITTWFSAPYFQSLSVYRARFRTNNLSESANRMLRGKTGVHQPSLWHYLSALRKYEREAYLAQRTLDAGLPLTDLGKSPQSTMTT